MLETLEIDESLGNSAYAAIYEANKHYGLEPVNIDFDPDTYQWEKDTCAIRSQEIVLRSFGVFVPQDELIAQAEVHGWYSKGHGTSISDVGNLLDVYNVPNHRVADANIFNLIDELGHGHKVIVGVDIHELYGNSFWQSVKESLVGKTPNHAMIVSGIDTSNPDKPMVTLTDPGTGKTLFECPYEKFLSAWDDSSCFMVATNNAAPLEYNTDTMLNFDYQNGHLTSVGKIPFDYFQNSIALEAEEYINSLDEYIDSVEKLINNGFSSQELFDDMMNKSAKNHQEAEVLQKSHHEEEDDQNKSGLHEKLNSNIPQNHEEDDDIEDEEDDDENEDMNF